MKKSLFISAVIVFIFSACSSNGNKPELVSTIDTAAPSSASSDTFHINEPGIVFADPSEKEIAKQMAADSESFFTIVDDYSFYSSQLIETADSMHIKSAGTTAPVLDFKTTDNKHIIIDRDKQKDNSFQTYLFNGSDAPQVAEIGADRDLLTKFFKK